MAGARLPLMRAVVVQHLPRDDIGLDQLLRARQPRRRRIGLHHQAMRRPDRDPGPAQLRLRLALLRAQLDDVIAKLFVAGVGGGRGCLSPARRKAGRPGP